jgi:FtsP/CotA-like multicopper oxidase with cupredoxin domain
MLVRQLPPAALLVLLAGCSTGSDPGVAAPPTRSAPTTSSTSTPTATVIEVTYAGGEVTTASPRVELSLGEEVVLRVTSDVAEEIHLHGYDLYEDIPAGGTGEVSFTADLPGAYEVELQQAGRPLVQLRVA